MNIHNIFQIYLDDKKVYCADKSCDFYRNMLHVFSIYLDSHSIFDTSLLSPDVLKNYVVYLRHKGIKNTSIHTYMRGVNNFLNWGILNGMLPPFDYHIKLPRPDPDQILPLSTDEVNNILKYIRTSCYDPDNKELLFRLLLDCGMRSSEALSLSLEDIDTTKNLIMINQSKYDKSRMIPLPERVKHLLPSGSGSLFSFDSSGKNSFFARLKAGSGVPRLYAHLLRHTFATSYMVNVGNLEFLRMYLGHSSYDVTKTYIQSAFQCKMLKYDIYKIDDIFT